MAEREQELRRQLAAIEHERWAGWQRWMHDQCVRLDSGELVIPAALVERWERQIATPYADLDDTEQASDMEQVDRYWPLIAAVLECAERVEAAIRSSQWVEETMLALLAEEGGYFFGMPIKWEITWPEGLPRQFRDREAVKAWAVERLATVWKTQEIPRGGKEG